MSLQVLYSSDINILAEDLKEKLSASRRAAENPLTFTDVVVPNGNLAQWLQIKVFADMPELSMGINFPFIVSFFRQALLDNLGIRDYEKQTRDREEYAFPIMREFVNNRNNPLFAPFTRYICGDDASDDILKNRNAARKAWQLAQKLGALIDTYEARRPDLLDKWLQEDFVSDNPVENAEAALARALFPEKKERAPENLSLRELFLKAKESAPAVDKQPLYFFGHSIMPRLHAEILHYLAQSRNIIFYYHNVCCEYWGDIQTAKELSRSKLNTQLADNYRFENVLLNEWGKAGRETIRFFSGFEDGNCPDISYDMHHLEAAGRENSSLLAAVQKTVRDCTNEFTPGKTVPQDPSLQIFGAPGIRREVETVYNSILWSVSPKQSEKDALGDCTFSDIAVLVTDMATYRPYIEAIFDPLRDVRRRMGNNAAIAGEIREDSQYQPIPYGIIDTTAADYSEYLAGFSALSALHTRGLTRETLFTVLENPLAQRALRFSPDEVADWRALTEKIGAFDYFDDDDVEKHGRAPATHFTWSAQLQRLRLSAITDTLPRVEGISLPSVELNDRESARRFSEIVELLYRRLKHAFAALEENLRKLATVPDDENVKASWAAPLRETLDMFLEIDDDDILEHNVRNNIHQILRQMTDAVKGQPADSVIEGVTLLAGAQNTDRGGYLTHGVTVAGLLPMRPVPFKQIYILGLGEGGFPGSARESSLDFRGLGKGLPVTVPDVNRFLFLETLMVAQERLVLSYVNEDIAKDAELFPSGVIRTLEDFLADKITGQEITGFAETPVPLLAREHAYSFADGDFWEIFSQSRHYQDKTVIGELKTVLKERNPFAGLLRTASHAEWQCAQIVRSRPAETRAFIDNPADIPAPDGHTLVIPLETLADFIRTPFKTMMNKQFHIQRTGYRNNNLDPDSPLGLPEGPVLWDFEDNILEMAKTRNDAGEYRYDAEQFSKRIAALCRQKQFAGQIPEAFLGKFVTQNLMETYDINKIREMIAEEEATREAADYCRELSSGSNCTTELLPSRGLREFFSILHHIAYADDDAPKTVLISLFSLRDGKHAAWEWKINRERAKNYLQDVQAWYLAYQQNTDHEGLYVNWQFDSLGKNPRFKELKREFDKSPAWPDGVLPDDDELTAILKGLSEPPFETGLRGNPGFNNDLVVGQVLEAYLRQPNENDLAAFREIYRTLFRLPFSGRKIDRRSRLSHTSSPSLSSPKKKDDNVGEKKTRSTTPTKRSPARPTAKIARKEK